MTSPSEQFVDSIREYARSFHAPRYVRDRLLAILAGHDEAVLAQGEQAVSRREGRPVSFNRVHEACALALERMMLTDDEMEALLLLPHQSLSARRRELVQAGLVVASGWTRKTRTGHTAKVWRLTPEGLAWASTLEASRPIIDRMVGNQLNNQGG